MQFEIDQVTELHRRLTAPVRVPSQDNTTITVEELKLRQRLIREETSETIDALLKTDLTEIADGCVDTMVVTAGTMVQLGLDVDTGDFVYAAKELLEDARIPILKGLQQREWSDVKIGGVMLEIVVRGICAVTNVPYRECWDEVQRSNLAKVGPLGPIFDAGGKFTKPEGWIPPDIQAILLRHGLIKPVEPITANDEVIRNEDEKA